MAQEPNNSSANYSAQPDSYSTPTGQPQANQQAQPKPNSQADDLKRYEAYLKKKQQEAQQNQTKNQTGRPQRNQNQQQPQQNQIPYDYPEVKLEDSRLAPGFKRPVPEQTVLEWTSPSRVFKKKNKKYFSTILVIAALISLILFFAGQILPVAVVIAAVFLIYVLSVVPPPTVKYKITTYGIRVENQVYYWIELGRFWLETKDGFNLVNIELGRFPNRLSIILPPELEKEAMRLILGEVLLNEKPKLTTYEKVAQWLQEKIPIDAG